LLIYTANYINFLGYNVLIRNIKTSEGPELRKRTNPYFITMNLIYLLNFGLAFTQFFGPWCTSNNLYPPCLTIAACLYWTNYAYHSYLSKNSFFLKWEGVSEE
jgi:hypothetical protein